MLRRAIPGTIGISQPTPRLPGEPCRVTAQCQVSGGICRRSAPPYAGGEVEGWSSSAGSLRGGSRELPGPGSPKEADPEGISQPAGPPPGLTSRGAQNSAHANESGSVNTLLGSHLPVGSSRAAAELRSPTRPPFIHLSPTPVRGGAADQSWVRLGSRRRALLPDG